MSDHALLRFLERVGGMDIETVRAAIAASLERAAIAAESIGITDHVIVADDMMYLVREGVVVTVLHKADARARAIVSSTNLSGDRRRAR